MDEGFILMEENKESSAFKELLGLEYQDQGVAFSMLEDTQNVINTNEEEPSMDKKNVKNMLNYLIEQLKKL